MKNIYFDNAATTKVAPEVLKIMIPYFIKHYGNPSEYHKMGITSRKAIEEARNKIAAFLRAKHETIIFTSSATESINLAHKGLIEAMGNKFPKNVRPHIITSAVEHKAVLETCYGLERNGKARITYLPVNRFGRVEVESVEQAVSRDTVLVSIMYVNNEVGTIQPISEIGQVVQKLNHKRKNPIYFHTDATQALGFLDCNVDNLGVDLLSFTGHKINAPKGIGVLYIRKGVEIKRQIDGGNQEKRLRAGTENTPYIVGLAKALELVNKQKKDKVRNLTILRNRLVKELSKIPGVKLTGDPEKRTPHIASFIVDGVEGEGLVLYLSNLGIYASSGSACTSMDLSASHVLTAMGFSEEEAHGSIRFSLGKDTKTEDIDYLIKVLPTLVKKIRKMNPTYNKEQK